MTSESSRGFSMITGVELGEEKEPDANRPSLILRRAGDGRLWDSRQGKRLHHGRHPQGKMPQEEPAARGRCC